MSTTTKLSREQAEAALAAVKAQWAKYLTPTDHSGHPYTPADDAALAEHLIDQHGYDRPMVARVLDRATARGQTLSQIHADHHEPVAVYTTPPVLVEDWNGEGWAISWEEGPDEWAFRVNSGDPAEADYVQAHDVAVEFGVEYDSTQVKGPGPAPGWPKGVEGSPYYSFVLTLHPA